jgi:hypothetical protein
MVTISLCILCAAHPTFYLLERLQLADWKIEGLIDFFERDARKIFKLFLWNSPNPRGSALLSFFTLLSLFSNLVDKLINTYADIMFCVTVFLFQNLVKYFSQSLKDTVSVSPGKVGIGGH